MLYIIMHENINIFFRYIGIIAKKIIFSFRWFSEAEQM